MEKKFLTVILALFFVAEFAMALVPGIDAPASRQGLDNGQTVEEYLPDSIYSGLQGKHHVQGIVVDKARGHVYFSFTTRLIKTDMQGKLIGSVDGLTGHLGCLTYNEAESRIYGSLEYKDDAVGRGIAGETARKRENALYIAMFDTEKIVRPNMKPEDDNVMKTVYLADAVKDYTTQVTNGGKTVEHRYGCSGIDGVAFAPRPGKTKDYVLYVAYGIYSDVERTDNDYQVLLTYDTRDWDKYAQPLSEDNPHHSGPAKPTDRYFVYTGNTSWGIQNLCYDPSSRTLFAAVYKGVKPGFPNYSLFAIDLTKKATKERLKGFDSKEKGKTLPLKKLGKYDAASGTYGWHFPYGSTGLCALGNGLFYISHNSSKPEQSSTLHLYKWDGGTSPFQMR